jgi:integrase
MAARKKTHIEALGTGFMVTVGKKSRQLPSRALAEAWAAVETAPEFRHVRIQFNAEERRPFIVAHPSVTNGKASTARKKFGKFTDARRFAETRDIATENHGRKFLSDLSKDEIAAVTAWREEAGRLGDSGVVIPSLAETVRESLARLVACPDGRLVGEELVEEFIQRKKDHGIGSRQVVDYRQRLKRFIGNFGGRAVASITSSEIEQWLAGLQSLRKGGGAVSAQTRKHHRAALHAFFGWVLPQRNPIGGIEAPRVKAPARDHYTPADAWKLMEWLLANDMESLPAVALGFFCGLRTAEIARLDLSTLDLRKPNAEGEFILRGDQAKREKARAVPLLPAAKAWLLAQTRRSGPAVAVPLRTLHERIAAAHTGADLRRIPNGARHSFATFRGAILKDSGRLSDEMGNSAAIVRRHYREPKLEAEAVAFFALRPGIKPKATVDFRKEDSA